MTGSVVQGHKWFISVDIDNYDDKFQIFISLKFKDRFLLLRESCRNQAVNCVFELLFIVRTWQTFLSSLHFNFS